MAMALQEYFGSVTASDVFDYGYGAVRDFLASGDELPGVDWTITNPPFRFAEKFVFKALEVSRIGAAMLTRTVFLESVGRYDRLFKAMPPTVVAQFSERVPMIKGRVDRKASTATGYAWLLWMNNVRQPCELVWIPPCRKLLERDTDYVQHPSPPTDHTKGSWV
jgi:hypothetical protein